MAEEQIEEGIYTLQELAYCVSRLRSVTPKNLRKWLPWALIPTKKEYSRRDLKKLLFIAHSLNRINSFKVAQRRLLVDLAKNPHKYQEDSPNARTATVTVESHA